MCKVSIIGAGNVGATAAQKIANLNICEDIVLLDIKPGIAEGKAMDICQSGILEGIDTNVIGVTNDYKFTAFSDIIIITSGVPRKPGMTREELIDVNSGIMKSVLSEVHKYSPDAIYIIVSNPMDTMTYFAYKYLKVPATKVIGMGGLLDNARFCYYIADKLGVSRSDVSAAVIGAHSDTGMVPLVSNAYYNDLLIETRLTKEEIEDVVVKTKNGGAILTGLLGTSAWEAPAAGITALVKALLDKDSETYMCCSVYRKEYDVCIGSLVWIDSNGINRIVPEKDLISYSEKEAFAKSIESVKALNKKLSI